MIKSTPTNRQYITLVPDSNHKITLLYDEHKFETEIIILNISINAVKLSMSFLPAGLKSDEQVTIDMVFNEDNKPMVVNTQAKVFKIIECERSFEVVLLLKEDKRIQKLLIDYIAKLQMRLIREFKGIDYAR